MKNSILLFLSILTLSCQNNQNSDLFIGTWNKCNRAGEYFEWKIEKNHLLMLGGYNDEPALLKNKIENNSLIIEGINVSLPTEIDTLALLSITENKIILRSSFHDQIIELKKMENQIDDIDSLNLKKWKNETILKFQKRAELYNCPDLRTEEEKIIHDLGTVDIGEVEEIEIPLDKIKDTLK